MDKLIYTHVTKKMREEYLDRVGKDAEDSKILSWFNGDCVAVKDKGTGEVTHFDKPKGIKPFAKDDTDKVRLELIEPEFIEGIGAILTFGATKYGAHNWKQGNEPASITRIIGALLRHINEYNKGNKLDGDTGKSHLYHAACNLMFLDYFDKTSKETT